MSNITDQLQGEIRELRLWHWQELLKCRKVQSGAVNTTLWHTYERQAARHMRAVQTLNSFFQAGDTAERDYAADRQPT